MKTKTQSERAVAINRVLPDTDLNRIFGCVAVYHIPYSAT
jgi:hypothetical protein